MWDIEFNTGFKFSKSFETKEQAEKFFYEFKKKILTQNLDYLK